MFGILKFTSKTRVQGTGIPFQPIFGKKEDSIIVRSRLKNQSIDMWAKVRDSELVEILGPVGELEVETEVLKNHFNINNKYPKINYDNLFLPKFNIFTHKAFTVDGNYTLDRDDAISIDFYDSYYEIGVHIINTTEIITPDLFKSVQERGSSAYWLNNSTPMLSPQLAHDILSLNQGNIYPCISVFLKYSLNNILLETYHKNTSIYINKNYTYENFNDSTFLEKMERVSQEKNIEDIVAWLMIQYNLYMAKTLFHKNGLLLRVQEDENSFARYETVEIETKVPKKYYHCKFQQLYAHFTSPIRRFADMNNQFVYQNNLSDLVISQKENVEKLNQRMTEIKLFHYHQVICELAYKHKDTYKNYEGFIKTTDDGKFIFVIIDNRRIKIPVYDSYSDFKNLAEGEYKFELFGIIKDGKSTLRIRLVENEDDVEKVEETETKVEEVEILKIESEDKVKIKKDLKKDFTISFENAKYRIESVTGYPIDEFQQNCLKVILSGSDLLGMAPTGSGKTLVALMAILIQAFDQGKRAILTTPIKALSNQKFSEFFEWFQKITNEKRITLLTGDIQARATPPGGDGRMELLIMTSEILANKLDASRRNNVLDDDLANVSVIVMDEIHYINDPHRGHVWERSIMTLPKNIQIVALSATLSEPENLRDWMSVRQKTEIVQRNDRHVPLYVGGVVNNRFLEIMNTHESKKILDSNVYNNLYKNKFDNSENKIEKLIKILEKDDKLPAIIFLFSRNKCIEMASSISWNLLLGVRPNEKDFHDEFEYLYQKEEYEFRTKNIIHKQQNIINKYLHPYREILEKLPGYFEFIKMIGNGVAYHHAGMLPILRELIEILFQNKLLKIVFATETLGVGINMPARTVVLTQLEKPNGQEFSSRLLRPDEFWQMAGRAGRRGIDTKGYVIYFPIRHPISEFDLRKTLFGEMPHAESQLKIDQLFVLKYIKDFENPNKVFDQTLLKHGYSKYIKFWKNELNSLKVFSNDMIQDYKKRQKINDKINDKLIRPTPKQLKTYKKEISDIEKKYENFIKEFQGIEKRLEIEKNIFDYENALIFEWNFSKSWLLKYDYITDNNDYTYKGLIASKLYDGSPLIRGDIIASKYLENLTFAEIVGFLALFTDDVRISETQVIELPKMSSNFENIYNRCLEMGEELNYRIHYNTSILLHEWALNKDIYIISRYLDISQIGVFVRVILRVISFIDELKNILLGLNNYELYNLLENHHDRLLNNVVTNKSLYIN